ncbi:MAG: O-sialoglycoprotein endopeptidase [Parcubacteria bacterium C7867-004]|nr:MAG: O-sialoglycoprotein endopeptidase [Parcubacteria bacterium C7867-004]
MKILAIETSCDETAISILECSGDERLANFRVLGNALLSQIDIHKEYGGVFPMMAKREHAKNLVPILGAALEEAELLHEDTQALSEELTTTLGELLSREFELAEQLLEFLKESEIPDIDAIAVTHGPGLEPALWVGVNFAKALSLAWNKPLIGVNHMEGHLLSSLVIETDGELVIKDIGLPVLGLLISGGHTELVSMDPWLSYRLIGQTRDDAVGEAFDKVARMLGLPYPGGPEISKLAERNREDTGTNPFKLPRPMITDPHCDFSFSGLKTAVMYLVKGKEVSELEKEQLAHAFEDAVAEVLWKKTARALEETGAKTLALGGGVSANTHLRRYFAQKISEEYPEVALFLPDRAYTTDNAIMIAIAGYYRALHNDFANSQTMIANGNLALT